MLMGVRRPPQRNRWRRALWTGCHPIRAISRVESNCRLELLDSAAHKVELVVGRQQSQKRVMPNRNQTIVISSHIPDGIHFPINPGALHEHVEYLFIPTSEYQICTRQNIKRGNEKHWVVGIYAGKKQKNTLHTCRITTCYTHVLQGQRPSHQRRPGLSRQECHQIWNDDIVIAHVSITEVNICYRPEKGQLMVAPPHQGSIELDGLWVK